MTSTTPSFLTTTLWCVTYTYNSFCKPLKDSFYIETETRLIPSGIEIVYMVLSRKVLDFGVKSQGGGQLSFPH